MSDLSIVGLAICLAVIVWAAVLLSPERMRARVSRWISIVVNIVIIGLGIAVILPALLAHRR